MANRKGRLKAPSKTVLKGIGKMKNSSTGTNIIETVITNNDNSNSIADNQKVQHLQNCKAISNQDSLPNRHIKDTLVVAKNLLPILTRSGRILRKSKDKIKLASRMLKKELMIHDNSKVKKLENAKSSPVKNGANNNNNLAIINNNTGSTSSSSSDTKCSNNKSASCARNKPNNKLVLKVNVNKNKSKISITSSKTPSDSMEEGMREEVINKMKSVLSPDEESGNDLLVARPFNKKKPRSIPTKINTDANKNGANDKNLENNSIKNKTEADDIDKADGKSTQMKQVTLSNGVVLTMAWDKCDYCEKSFSNKPSLSRHMLSHVDLRRHNCLHCPRKFRYQATLRIHMQRCHPTVKEVPPEYYMCNICDKAFLMQENLELHLASHVKTENNFKCLYCDKKFSYRLLLVQHEKTHLVTGRFKCYLCDMSYTSRSRLSHHIKVHMNIKEFICQYCGKEFFRLNSIKRHVQVCHDGQMVQCPICMKKLKGHLSEHMRVHEKKRPYVCLECGQRFTQSTQLTVHKRSHTGDRPYSCRICKRPFGHSNALMLHIRRHTGEKPFTCAMCPMSFSQLPHMKTHMSKIHGKENAYKCKKCDEFFKLKAALDAHLKTCTVGDRELSFEEKIQVSVQTEEVEIESAMSLSKMRFLLALLLTNIASKDKLKYLGFNKRLIDELLEECLEAMGCTPCQDNTLSPLGRLRKNIEMFLKGTVPKPQMEKFQDENKSTEEILTLLTDEKRDPESSETSSNLYYRNPGNHKEAKCFQIKQND